MLLLFAFASLVTVVFTYSDSPATVVPSEAKEDDAKHEKLQIDLLPFMELAHGLKSGPIRVRGSRTFSIENLHYDGKGLGVHFWVGKGSWPWDNGTLVLDENASAASLRAYNGENITLTLPDVLTVNDIDYLAVWSTTSKHNFGHTYTKKKAPGETIGVQIEPFLQLAHGLRSGPIIIVDEKTVFVPNFHYDGKGLDAHFWVGTDTEPSPMGVLVPDETGSTKPISAYTGQSIYITLPHNYTIRDFDYFGVWCIQSKHNFGHTVIPKSITVPGINGNPRYTSDDKEIIRVQKCCPINQVLLPTGCVNSNQMFNLNVTVHVHNASHIDDEPLRNVVFVPFTQSIVCEFQKYPLGSKYDYFALFKNSSLAVVISREIVSMDKYCFESVNLGKNKKENWRTTAIVCFNNATMPVPAWLINLYVVGIIVSIIFLVLTVFIFWWVKTVRNTRVKCVMIYSISMAVAFICLAAAQFSKLNETSCKVIAYLIQLSWISSFTWLTMVGFETFCKIHFHDTSGYTADRNRFWGYTGVGILIPTLMLGISLAIDRIPDIPTSVLKPQFGHNSCWFEQNKSDAIYFYVPIAVVIFCNIALAITMKTKLIIFQRRPTILWDFLQRDLKAMFRSCLILILVMSACWLTEMVSFFLDSSENVWKGVVMVTSFQGLFVFIVFVTHRPVINELRTMCNQGRGGDDEREEMVEMPLMRERDVGARDDLQAPEINRE